MEPSLLSEYPDVAAEWHPTLNGGLRPDQVRPKSGRRVWWRCRACGHEWESCVCVRASGCGCPACSGRGRAVVPGANDLATKRPDVAAWWHPERNEGLLPSGVRPMSGKTVWWKCPTCGFEWQKTVAGMTKRTACPKCTGGGTKIIPGLNDLATLSPAIAAEWHPHKNGGLSPSAVGKGSSKVVWWLCPECGGEWQARVESRFAGSGCPYCARRNGRAVPGKSDLATVNPRLAEEWHPSLNRTIKVDEVLPMSGMRVWWKCPKCGFEWQAAVASRSRGSGCPSCRRRRARAPAS